jgi:ADP-heptose:LPS heptosyltransferase
VLAAPLELAPLARLSRTVDEVVDARELEPLAETLHGANIAVNLHGRGPASHYCLLDSRPRRLIAFAHPDVPETAGMPDWQDAEHEVERWCRLLARCGIPAEPDRLGLPPPPILPPRRRWGATIVHPGAKSPARRWPAERWAAVVGHELRRGRRVVVTGSAEEAALARSVARLAGLPDGDVCAGRTTLLHLAALIAHAGRVVCGDTGVAHLATALGTPSVLLFGPTSPDKWGPPRERSRHHVLWHGKTGDPLAERVDPTLLEITVEEVTAALDLVASTQPSRVVCAGAAY